MESVLQSLDWLVLGIYFLALIGVAVWVALEKNKNSYQVTCAKDVKREWFDGVKQVGISAGASTPDELIEEVKEKISMINEEILNWKKVH